MFWSKNKQLNSIEYIQISKEIIVLTARLEAQEQLVKSLRGLVNRKIGYDGNDPQEKNEKQTNLNGTVFLSPNGTPI